jgi:predicted nuclease of predicted toxin-antitoxin system
VKLLLDNNLSWRLADLLNRAGWDVVHVRALGLEHAKDPVVLETARSQSRVLVSADTDFGALLAASHHAGPSVVLVRRLVGRRADEIAAVLLANLPGLEDDLKAGSMIAIGDDAIRIRRLPII